MQSGAKPADAPSPPASPGPAPDPLGPVGESDAATRILLAEDNELNLAVMSEYLEHAGFEVGLADNGEEALRRIVELRPALVVMDVQMPGMDGLEATRRLRLMGDPGLAQIPVLGLTALAMAGDRERCLSAGFTRYVSKPVSLKRLLAIVLQMLKPGAAEDDGDSG